MCATCPTSGSPDGVAPDSEACHVSSGGGVPTVRAYTLSSIASCMASDMPCIWPTFAYTLYMRQKYLYLVKWLDTIGC